MTETALVPYQAIKFQDIDVEIYDQTDGRWIIANQVSDAIQQARRTFRKLCSHLIEKNELLEGRHFKYLPLEAGGALQDTLVLSYLGIIRVMMRSNAPKAQQFRDWAEVALLEIMLTGKYNIQHHKTRSELEELQAVYMGNLGQMKRWVDEDPAKYGWVLPRMQDMLDIYITHFKVPRIGKTRMTDDLFAHFWMEAKWSRDAIIASFPLDFESVGGFEVWRKRMKLKHRNAKAIPKKEGLDMYRDYKYYYLTIEDLVIKYKKYSHDAIQKKIREIRKNMLTVYAKNEVLGVEPNKESYDKYVGSPEWDAKKTVTVAPDGPCDTCWDCHSLISISTCQMHHLTYARVGVEDLDDWVPLCRPCHIYRHPEVNGLAPGTKNPEKWVVIPNVRTTKEHASGKSFYCEINGDEKNIVHWAIDEKNSEVKRYGDNGTLIIKESFALSRGIAV
jgi:prophage antirepressor-like protein